MYKKTAVVIALLLGAVTLVAAQGSDTSRFDVHASVGTSVWSGFGRTQSVGWVAPSVDYRATERLTVSVGFGMAGTLLPQGYRLQGYTPSYAPVRHGTRAGAVWASAQYRVNERLTVWGMVEYLGGYMQPLWMDHSVPLRATAFSGGFAYQTGEVGLLEMHFHIVHDNYGTAALGPLGHPCYSPFAPEWDLYCAPWPF